MLKIKICVTSHFVGEEGELWGPPPGGAQETIYDSGDQTGVS